MSAAAGLNNGFVKQPVRQIGGEQGADGKPAGRLAEQRNILRIAIKCRDIPLYPFQRRDLIHDAVIAAQRLVRQCRMGKETKTADAVVEADEYHTLTGKLFT